MNLCIIPARGGSKRIPRKNIKLFCGKPIIVYSIRIAQNSGCFDKVIVSTDDEEIADIAKKHGAEIPFIRPKELSDDYTGTGQVVEHAVTWLRKHNQDFDYLCTIYATAPLLQEKYLIEGYKKLKESNAHMSFGVTSMPFPVQRTFKITSKNRCKMFFPENFNKRSQDLEEAYQDAGQFYWENMNNKFADIPFGEDSIPIVIPRNFVQDIDTIEDWDRAEILYNILHDIRR